VGRRPRFGRKLPPTAGTAIPAGDGARTVLAGWDPDSTWWLNDVLSFSSPREDWRNDGQAPFSWTTQAQQLCRNMADHLRVFDVRHGGSTCSMTVPLVRQELNVNEQTSAPQGLTRYLVSVIIWINGGFGSGKTTLAEELHRRLPDAVVYDPEDVGIMLWKWMRPNGDFQHLPSWRELVVATALALRRHHADTLIVPMSLIRDAYRGEILGGLAHAGEEVVHVFLAADASVLHERLNARVSHPDGDWDEAAREFGMTGVDEMVMAATRLPSGTLLLRSDELSPAELADEVLARVALRQAPADTKRIQQARTLDSTAT